MLRINLLKDRERTIIGDLRKRRSDLFREIQYLTRETQKSYMIHKTNCIALHKATLDHKRVDEELAELDGRKSIVSVKDEPKKRTKKDKSPDLKALMSKMTEAERLKVLKEITGQL